MIQHHGIIITDRDASEYERPPQREWPQGCISYDDSFLVWGEHRLDDDGAREDGTLHVIYEGPRSIADVRFSLSNVLVPHERLIDYVCISDKQDWSENGETFTLEQFEDRYSQ